MSWFALGLKILSCNICAMNKEQYSNSNLLNPRLYEFERNHFACNVERCISCMNMIYTACRNKNWYMMFFTWTNKLNLFSTIFFLYLILKSEKKLDLNYIHSHEFLISVIIFFWIWKYIYFYKRNWTMEFLILKWEKGLFFKKPKIKSCLAYNLAAVYQ